jgi:hypothetical protein
VLGIVIAWRMRCCYLALLVLQFAAAEKAKG